MGVQCKSTAVQQGVCLEDDGLIHVGHYDALGS
jgi:hypothetical protein